MSKLSTAQGFVSNVLNKYVKELGKKVLLEIAKLLYNSLCLSLRPSVHLRTGGILRYPKYKVTVSMEGRGIGHFIKLVPKVL